MRCGPFAVFILLVQRSRQAEELGAEKVVLVPEHLEGLHPDALVDEFGTDLRQFRAAVTLNGSHYHSVVKRQVRSIVARCCGWQTCLPDKPRPGGRPGRRRRPYTGPAAVASVKGRGVTIACAGCEAGWQHQLDFGHGQGYIPIACPGCPDDWRERLGMGPNAATVPPEDEEGEYEEEGEEEEYEEDEETTPTTTAAP